LGDETRGVVVEKPRANIYTVLLAIALTAILIGCLCMYFELDAYEWTIRGAS